MINAWRKASAPLAVGLGPAVIVIAVLRNWHGWEAPPFWLDDFGAGAALFAAGAYGITDQGRIRGRLISCAYGLAVAVLWGSLFEPTAGLHPAPAEWSAFPIVSRFLTALALAIAAIGLLCSLPSHRPAFIGTRPEPERKPAKKKARR